MNETDMTTHTALSYLRTWCNVEVWDTFCVPIRDMLSPDVRVQVWENFRLEEQQRLFVNISQCLAQELQKLK